jgi:Alginate export
MNMTPPAKSKIRRMIAVACAAGALSSAVSSVRGQDAAPGPVLVPVAAPAAQVAESEPMPATESALPNWRFWMKVPSVPVQPPLGNYPIEPSAPGYYSLRDLVFGDFRDPAPRFPYPPSLPSADGGGLKYAYPPYGLMRFSFFNADFSFLDDPNYTQPRDFFDEFHRIHLCDDWMLSFGGEVRDRQMSETNSRLGGKSNDYDLFRARTYADVWYLDMFRFYSEFLYADTSGQQLTPLVIDRDRGDFLNLFFDIKLAEIEGHNAYARVGRQELLLGSERLVTPLEWANTRRTFDGVSVFRYGECWDTTAFYTRPVIPNPEGLSSDDDKQTFAGAWVTYRPEKGHFLDFYYMWLNNQNTTTTLGVPTAPNTVNTLGTRYTGNRSGFLWDTELMLQFGDVGTQNLLAGSTTFGIGYNFGSLPMNPTFWFYYDWASGSSHPGAGTDNTFNQLFAFGHYYLGLIDDVGRQNIQDVSAQVYVFPTNWINCNVQYHHFNLDSATDALYNAAGTPIRRDATGAAGTNVGDEIDIVTNFHLGPHTDVLLGASWLFPGTFIDRTGPSQTAKLFYAQYTFRW